MNVKTANPVPLQFRALCETSQVVKHLGLDHPQHQPCLAQIYECTRELFEYRECDGLTYVDQVYLHGERMDMFAHRNEKEDHLLVTLAATSMRHATLDWKLQLLVRKRGDGETPQYVIPLVQIAPGAGELPYPYFLTVLHAIGITFKERQPLRTL